MQAAEIARQAQERKQREEAARAQCIVRTSLPQLELSLCCSCLEACQKWQDTTVASFFPAIAARISVDSRAKYVLTESRLRVSVSVSASRLPVTLESLQQNSITRDVFESIHSILSARHDMF